MGLLTNAKVESEVKQYPKRATDVEVEVEVEVKPRLKTILRDKLKLKPHTTKPPLRTLQTHTSQTPQTLDFNFDSKFKFKLQPCDDDDAATTAPLGPPNKPHEKQVNFNCSAKLPYRSRPLDHNIT